MPRSKRLFDVSFSALALVLLAPLLVLLGALIWLFNGRPIFFIQQRPGFKGRPFGVIKFRTMREARDVAGLSLPDSVRLTRFGRFMRSLSLDELPELMNILRGEMSLVGPRPLMMQYLPLYSAEQMRRHDVHPGLTGWAQVHGRNALDWPERFRMDVWYVDHGSFLLDLRIILLTIWKVISRQGVSQPGRATTEYFAGNKD
jgi:lipopolysaccharide/colanic/teichoic acid biosynthesis glycosyltransferase